MRRAQLGGIEVSVIGLGCNNMGRALDQEGSTTVVDAALEAGIDFFDTADSYGQAQSEVFLGKALGSRRDRAVIATKFGNPVPGEPDTGGAHPDYVPRALEASLRRLGTDHIDLYQLHRPDPDVPIVETLGAMGELVERGVVREIGCSNFDAAQLSEAATAAADAEIRPFASDQIEYSMLHRDPRFDGLKELALDEGLALLPYYPLACGLLTGKVQRGVKPDGRLSMDRYQYFLTDENFDLVDRLRVFASDRDMTPAEVALGWLLAQPEVPAVTPGATKPSQIASNVRAAAWEPSDGDLAELEALIAPRSGAE